MTSEAPTRQGSARSKQLSAVATAALPVVMLSSLAMAQPAQAVVAQAPTAGLPSALMHGGLAAAVKSAQSTSSISAAVIAGTVPAGISQVVTTSTKTHTVVQGDTVSGIAAKYQLTTAEILSLNNLGTSSLIHPGQQIKLSAGASSTSSVPSTNNTAAGSYVVQAGDTLSGIAANHGVSLSTILAGNGLTEQSVIHPGQLVSVSGAAAVQTTSSAPSAAATTGGKYIIVSGDTLSSIAARHNVSAQDLASVNGLNSKSTIYAGKTLDIPGVSAASTAVTPLAAEPVSPGELPDSQKVPSTFLHYTYPDAVVSQANVNKAALLAAPAPTRAQMQEMVARTAASMGVDPALALAFAQQESGFNHQSVSPANAIGTMQVIPSAGEWASDLVGKKLNLLVPQDNVTAGVAIIRALLRTSPNEDLAIAGYYQGQYSVSVHGMFSDTVTYVSGIKTKRSQFR